MDNVGPGKVRTSLILPVELFEALRLQSFQTRVSQNKIVVDALAKVLAPAPTVTPSR